MTTRTRTTRLVVALVACGALLALLPATSALAVPSTSSTTSSSTSTSSTTSTTTAATASATPSVSVAPGALLTDGQVVHVEAAGFGSGEVLAFECTSTSYDPSTCVELASAPSGGSLTTDVPLPRHVAGVDCARPQCAVVATSDPTSTPVLTASRHVTFRPFAVDLRIDTSHPLPIGPDGQVTVTGTLTCAQTTHLGIMVEVQQPSPSVPYGPADIGHVTSTAGPTRSPGASRWRDPSRTSPRSCPVRPRSGATSRKSPTGSGASPPSSR